MQISLRITSFHGRKAPEEGFLVGYAAILEAFQLDMPIPDTLSLISLKKRKYKVDNWQVFTPRY